MIRIYIGKNDNNIVIQVLKHSILSRTKENIDFFISSCKLPLGKSNDSGSLICLSSEQIVLTDIRKLWNVDNIYPNPQASIWMTKTNNYWDHSVRYIDLNKPRKYSNNYQQISNNWHCCNEYTPN